MSTAATAPGPLAAEIAERLAALDPIALDVINDSGRHAGHMGDDGSGESHFTVAIASARFAGLSRVARQRLVNATLGNMLEGRIHALAIRATAPGEAG